MNNLIAKSHPRETPELEHTKRRVRRAEQAVRECHQLLDLVLATLPVGVAVTDRGGDIALAHAASERNAIGQSRSHE